MLLPNGMLGIGHGPQIYVALGAIYTIVAAFASTWGIVGRLYAAEIVPTRYRARACAVQQWVHWTINFLVTFTGPFFGAPWPFTHISLMLP